MPVPAYEQQQRSFHLKRLDRFLNRMGMFGTALVDPHETVTDGHECSWMGLLVWNIAHGAESGVLVRCEPGHPSGAWRYEYDDGTVIAGVFDQLKVVQELTRVLQPDEETD